MQAALLDVTDPDRGRSLDWSVTLPCAGSQGTPLFRRGFPQQFLRLGLQHRHLLFHDVPHHQVVNRIVAVGDAVGKAMMAGTSEICWITSGAFRARWLRASPTISNLRSVAERNCSSFWYSAKLRPAAKRSIAWHAVSTSSSNFFASSVIDKLPGRLHRLAEVGIANGPLCHQINLALK